MQNEKVYHGEMLGAVGFKGIQASASSSLNFGVERLQFHAGIFNAELPATPIFSLEVALAIAFLERCREFCEDGGTYATVTPQNWLFLTSYRNLRVTFLQEQVWDHVAKVGSGANGAALSCSSTF